MQGTKELGVFRAHRLGTSLNLYTRTNNGKLVHLFVDWKKFEIDDPEKEISSVKLNPIIIKDEQFTSQTSLPAFNHGTCLVIEDLRQLWGRLELRKLREELERFIIDPEKEFRVHLKSLDIIDQQGKLEFDETIENKLLSKIGNKTISVHSEITSDGKSIKTALHHDGNQILSFEKTIHIPNSRA